MGRSETIKPSADVVALDEERQKRTDGPDEVSIRPEEPSVAEAPVTEAVAPSAQDEEVSQQDDLETAGGMLKAAREALGLDVQTMAERIKIRRDQIEAIEAMDVKKLPAPPYTLGFVRAFAREVALPEDALLKRFRRQAGYGEAPWSVPPMETATGGYGQRLDGSRELSVLALLAITAFILFCVWNLLLRNGSEGDVQETRFETPAEEEASAPVGIESQDPQSGGEQQADSQEPQSSDTAVEGETSSSAAAGEAARPAAPTLKTQRPTEGDTARAEPAQPATEPSEPTVVRARPRLLIAREPVYPPLCEGDAANVERVKVGYSVGPDGKPIEPVVLSTTNPCFNGA
ncbi:MAG: helix-turn-helix domain-containing protein, partial [Pseudomonadota bacterium]